ncbi:MAG: peptide MFS transporter, partial [Bacteroidales bacterium]|nr:peptide MFS transporter [Bacteroidales bacterium]
RDQDGTRRVLGETISNTAFAIMVFQIPVSWIFERYKAIPSFTFGLLVMGLSFVFLSLAGSVSPAWIFVGIFLFAIGEMITSPRIQEYITWLAPKEKAGLYMGSNFLAVGIGGFLSGTIYTSRIYSHFERSGHTEYVWLVLGGHILAGVIMVVLFSYFIGHFKEQES